MIVLIPAAGNGRRFAEAGYKEPKPMIDVLGKPMVIQVANNVVPDPDNDELVLITRKEHNVGLGEYWGNGRVIALDHETGGAVETILEAKPVIDNLHKHEDLPILIANCDQLVDFDVKEFVNTDLDGRLVVFPSSKPHHSYVKTEGDVITEIAEKVVISNQAVTGVYYFKSSKAFFTACQAVIDRDQRTNGEFYVSSAIAEMIGAGRHIGVYEAPSTMLGTPEELQHFLVAARVAKTL